MKPRMKPRKIVLASACLVLLVIAIIQAVYSRIDPVKIISLKEEIDEIKIERPEGNITFRKSGDEWYLNERYTANYNSVESLADSFSEVKLLGKVTKTDNQDVLAKYDLNDERMYKVTVSHGGTELKTYKVGKSTSTNSQVYVMLDNSNDVYMAAGMLQNECSKSVNEFRSKVAFQIPKDDMTSITVTPVDGESWTVNRGGEGNLWTITGPGVTEESEVDADIISGWFNGCASVAAIDWLGDEEEIPGEKIFDIGIQISGRLASLSLYEGRDADDTEIYWGKTSETPYNFKVAKYTVDKYRKNPEDFLK
ncbi:MAG: DUF4340 domain-containing protein [Treponema sp.]|nr:DUF4340 domain-containing protein [Treponema sp.]